MDGTVMGRGIGRLASSMAWLGLLYGGLLYVAVGTLGVSEINANLGEQAVEVFRSVRVMDQAMGETRRDRRHSRVRLAAIDVALDKATGDLQSFGVGAGLSIDKIQPVIDTYDYSPRLGTLLGAPVDADAERKWAGYVATVMRLQMDRKRVQQAIDEDDRKLDQDWVGSIPRLPGDANGRVIDRGDIAVAANAATALRHLGYDRLFMLPREILGLVLALVMGALGSTLHVTKAMIEDKREVRPSYYLVRPFQGMVTALVVFILLKAGQLSISSGSGSGQDLNTFFVAFAGVVSGLMVSEAYQMIRKAAAAVIPPEDDEARWAFKLADALAELGAPAGDLAAGIGAAPAEVQAWVEEKRPVPAPQQWLVAAWLHRPRRSLFTSLSPDDGAPTAESGPPAAPAAVVSAE